MTYYTDQALFSIFVIVKKSIKTTRNHNVSQYFEGSFALKKC